MEKKESPQNRYYWKNRERILVLQKEYRNTHPVRKAAEMTPEERDILNTYHRLRYRDKGDNRRKSALEYYYRNRERILEQRKVKYQKQKEANETDRKQG